MAEGLCYPAAFVVALLLCQTGGVEAHEPWGADFWLSEKASNPFRDWLLLWKPTRALLLFQL